MPFKYNDKLIIKNREEMEELFKHRLNEFDKNRIKKIEIQNSTFNDVYIMYNIDKVTKQLNIKICDIGKIGQLPLRPTQKLPLSLTTNIKPQD